MSDLKSQLRVAGTACSILISFEALELMAMYSEVRDDGLKSVGRTFYSDVLLSIAPFGLTPFIAPLLVGALYWILSFRSPPTAHSLIFPTGLAAIGWTACTVAADFYREFIQLDGGRTPTVGMWVSNSLLIAGLMVLIYRSWSHRRSG